MKLSQSGIYFWWNRSFSASNTTFLHSVVCLLPLCHLLHSRTMFKLFDGYRCHLTGKLVASNTKLH